ncbi:hypothetical protein COLO4_02785 [Corchorus olitorius]|uniref:Uncharacterized protein n=1 Tax=Corchorus olitorius TaxID=93759 RepID=A0A1R3L084_9ROSI|nr:hypothetical protein COLO4_02785 [Corchorus olitorius]
MESKLPPKRSSPPPGLGAVIGISQISIDLDRSSFVDGKI